MFALVFSFPHLIDNLQVAPLRVRPADIADLQKLFARSIAKSRGQGTLELTKEAVLQLESYTFPGNIKASFVPSVSYMLTPGSGLQL